LVIITVSNVTNWTGSTVNKLLRFALNVTVRVNNIVQY